MATTKDNKDADGTKVVPVQDGTEHGYIGTVRPDKDRESFTVTGVTGGTGNVSDTPKSVTTKAAGSKSSDS